MKLTADQFLHRLLRSSAWSTADKARLYGLAACGYTSVAIEEVLRDNRIDAACFPTNIEREDPSPNPLLSRPMELFEFNLNELIGAQITDEAHREAYRHTWSNKEIPPALLPKYEKPIRDQDGFIWMQAWIFIKDFGHMFHWGGPEGVRTTIRIKKKDLKALASSIKDTVP